MSGFVEIVEVNSAELLRGIACCLFEHFNIRITGFEPHLCCNACNDALMGDIPPSGRLADTIAKDINDYPCNDCFGSAEENIHKEDIYVGYRYFEMFARDKVLYPFGYGLNYTKYKQAILKAERKEDKIYLSV